MKGYIVAIDIPVVDVSSLYVRIRTRSGVRFAFFILTFTAEHKNQFPGHARHLWQIKIGLSPCLGLISLKLSLSPNRLQAIHKYPIRAYVVRFNTTLTGRLRKGSSVYVPLFTQSLTAKRRLGDPLCKVRIMSHLNAWITCSFMILLHCSHVCQECVLASTRNCSS